MKLTNKTIVVTGVSSGIGAETARTLRAHGATVIGVDRNEPSLTLDAFVDLRLGDRGDERGDSEPEGDPLDEPIPSPIAHLPAPFLRPLPMGTRRENCG